MSSTSGAGGEDGTGDGADGSTNSGVGDLRELERQMENQGQDSGSDKDKDESEGEGDGEGGGDGRSSGNDSENGTNTTMEDAMNAQRGFWEKVSDFLWDGTEHRVDSSDPDDPSTNGRALADAALPFLGPKIYDAVNRKTGGALDDRVNSLTPDQYNNAANVAIGVGLGIIVGVAVGGVLAGGAVLGVGTGATLAGTTGAGLFGGGAVMGMLRSGAALAKYGAMRVYYQASALLGGPMAKMFGERIYRTSQQFGARHHGTYNRFMNSTAKQIRESMKSYNKRIVEHMGKMMNPRKYLNDGDKADVREVIGNMRGSWNLTLRNAREQIEIAKRVLRDRGK